jgi:hypothetical protein
MIRKKVRRLFKGIEPCLNGCYSNLKPLEDDSRERRGSRRMGSKPLRSETKRKKDKREIA